MSRFSDFAKPLLLLSILAAFAAQPIEAASNSKKRITPSRPKQVENKNAPTILQAEQITGRLSRELYLDYEVEVERDKTILTGDHGIFHQEENEVELIGNVFVQRFDDQFASARANINLDTGEGLLTQANYKIAFSKARGSAKYIELTGDDRTTLYKNTYSTCEGSDPDWYLKSDKLYLDNEHNKAIAKSPVLYFKNIPLFAAPAMTFPAKPERRSGVLPPTISTNSKNGLEVAVPYYFNLAPNYDLTLTPNYIARRGLQLGVETRYKGHDYDGTTYVEYLHDKKANRNRYFLSSQHRHNLGDGWSYDWDYNSASDDDYPDDFSSPKNQGAERLLKREGGLAKTIGNWTFSLRASKYKVLQDKDAPILNPFDRLPEFTVTGEEDELAGFNFKFYGNSTKFWLDDDTLHSMPIFQQARGTRIIAKPEFSYNYFSGGYFATPKIILNYAKYDLDKSYYNKKSLSHVIPTFSFDTGLVFERDSSIFGAGSSQTLEPRLFYVYTPYHNQSKYPIFDTGEASTGYALMFTENRFVGYDRISDANSLTGALTSRFIQNNGVERLRLTLGHRYYFDDQKVYLYQTEKKGTRNRSDMIALASGLISKGLSFDSGMQYNHSKREMRSANAGIQWKPGQRRLLNAGYRYVRDSLDFYQRYALGGEEGLKNYYKYWTEANRNYTNKVDQAYVSGQWPIASNLYLVGQTSYDISQSKAVENIFGIEYNSDCWIFRAMAQRYPTSSQETNTAFFFQLELKGLSRIGSNPLDTLEERIPGYEPLPSN